MGADVFWLGTAAIALEVGVVVLVFQRHRLAPLVALASGASLAVGYLGVHFLPARPWLSDSFTSATDVSPLSWVAASLEVLAAVALAAGGAAVLRSRGGLASATRPDPARRQLWVALLHPASMLMLIGNAVILAVSVSQL